MGATNDRYTVIIREDRNSERLQFFSDAVFAIAMTLLVIDIAVPAFTQSPTNAELGEKLLELFPQFLAYSISFFVIAINWMGHHRKFSVTHDYDATVIRINLLLLFLIAFVPFPTSLISEYPGTIGAVVMYAAVVSAISLVQLVLWSYTYRRGYLDTRIDLGIYRLVRSNLLVVPVVFGLSIPIAFIPSLFGFPGGIVAMFFWVLNWPASILVARLDRPALKNAAM